MVKKIILEISDEIREGTQDINKLLNTNDHLRDLIIKYKNKITDYYNNKSWDRYKKLSNEYEMIFTTPNTGSNLSRYTPVSRSFFKMWEMLYDFRKELDFDGRGLKVCMLCEGPGGFAEALIKYRLDAGYLKDEYYGISLKSDNNKNIPDWKVNNKYLNKININYGSDGTGNMYNMCNIAHFSNHVGKASVDFITADGGFDFSSDFNNQEEMSMQLIFSEILTALLIQKQGGSFILKIYDIFSENSLKIVHLLKKFYKKIYFVKPLTSRPANSEKYLICTGFSRFPESKVYYEMLCKIIVFNDKTCFNIPYDKHILENIVAYNSYYTMRQIFYIQRTIDYINMFKGTSPLIREPGTARLDINTILDEHKRKSLKWCKKYNISIN